MKMANKKILLNRIKYFFPGFCSSGAIFTSSMPTARPKKEIKEARK